MGDEPCSGCGIAPCEDGRCACLAKTYPVKLRRRTPEERADYLECKLLEMFAERTEAQDELDKVNAVLREHGFEYPLGARGVADAIGLYKARLEDPDFILAEAARLQRLADG